MYRGPPKNWTEVKALGRGGTGDVWLCHDTDANYQLVCKKIFVDGVSYCNLYLMVSEYIASFYIVISCYDDEALS